MSDVKPFHHKRPFDPSGDIFSNSVTRTMKSQDLNFWDMFTRETLQNSWDARDTTRTDDGVTFAVDYVTFDEGQVHLMRSSVFGDDFDGIPDLERLLNQRRSGGLMVCDTGTNGLRGPTSASVAIDGPKDFVSFVRNIGRSDTKQLAGGTFGMGKGVFYIASRVATILIYTRTTDEHGHPAHRFIAMANGDDFNMNGLEYTGRHWWGIRAVETSGQGQIEFAQPFEGEHADRLAAALGMDRYFTEIRKTGTTIVVLEPDLGILKDERQDVNGMMKSIADSLTRWAWPHMLGLESELDPIDFKVHEEGKPVRIPDPANDAALRSFISAYKAALVAEEPPTNQWESKFFYRVATIATSRPKADLGTLAVVDLPESISSEFTVVDQEITGHIALIRKPRMIVQYWQGPQNVAGRPYCGVFIANDEADLIFARSEPEAHHAWQPAAIQHDVELLEKFWGKRGVKTNPVKVFFNKMQERLKDTGQSSGEIGEGRHFQAITALSDQLGGLVDNAQSGNAPLSGGRSLGTSPRAERPQSRPRRKPRVTFDLATLDPAPNGYGVHSSFRLILQMPIGYEYAEFDVEPVVLADKNKLTLEDLGEAGLEMPAIVSSGLAHGEAEIFVNEPDNSQVRINLASTEAEVTLVVYQPPNCALSLKTTVLENTPPSSDKREDD